MLGSRQRSLFYLVLPTGTISPGRVSPRGSSAHVPKRRSAFNSIPHPLYAELPVEEQTRQTVESIRFLVERFDLDHRAFAFPHSDAGVREEFFKEMRHKRQLEVSFGTAGMRRHFFRWNLERFSMENSSLAAAQIVRMNYLRGLRRRMFS
jgi:hypothetical protein